MQYEARVLVPSEARMACTCRSNANGEISYCIRIRLCFSTTSGQPLDRFVAEQRL
jgi:hypothetical protein